MKLKSFEDVENFLYQITPNSTQEKYKGGGGLDTVKYFLELLGNPQEKYKVVHVAGTSGKGSTSHFTANSLQSQGFKVGLTVSPFVLDLRERIQILDKKNNIKIQSKMEDYFTNLLSKEKYVQYLNEIIPVLEKLQKTHQPPTYFELMTVLAFHVFEREKVDYVVLETGLGGLLDASNVIKNENKICLIAKIGFDHVDILGNSIVEIAKQKAGIIQSGNTVFTIEQDPEVLKVIEEECKNKNAKLKIIEKPKNIRWKKGLITFDFSNLKNLELTLLGEYQAENASFGLSVLKYVSKRDGFEIDEKTLRAHLKNTFIPGRFDIHEIKGSTLVLDMGHNPQKIGSFCDSLKKAFSDKEFNFIVGMKTSKDNYESLRIIKNLASEIFFFKKDDIFTKDALSQKDFMFTPAEAMEKTLEKLDYKNYRTFESLEKALDHSLENQKRVTILLGSVFSLKEAYNYVKSLTQ